MTSTMKRVKDRCSGNLHEEEKDPVYFTGGNWLLNLMWGLLSSTRIPPTPKERVAQEGPFFRIENATGDSPLRKGEGRTKVDLARELTKAILLQKASKETARSRIRRETKCPQSFFSKGRFHTGKPR